MSVTKLKAKLANKSGIEPRGHKVLVKPDKVDEYTEGGIYIPEQVTDVHQASAVYGYVVAVAPDAWSHITERKYHMHDNNVEELYEFSTRGYSEEFARVGDRIAYAPYSGARSIGEDGIEYIIINDEDVTARVSENVTQTSIEGRKPVSING